MARVDVGDRIPSFTLPDQDGRPFRIEDALAKGPVVLFFYPKDHSPGCTAEACGFRDASDDFADAGVQVVGISSDDVPTHRAFADAHRLAYPLLADEGGRVRRQFGVPKALLGLTEGAASPTSSIATASCATRSTRSSGPRATWPRRWRPRARSARTWAPQRPRSPMPTPRRLVVTGASTGFGRAIAVAARNAGWDVLGTVRKDTDAAALEAEGIATARLDLAVPSSIGPGVDTVLAWCGGRLDALVNNAGSTWPGPLEIVSMDDLRMQFEVNTFGHVDVTQRLLPALRQAGGRVLFVSSDSATLTPPMVGAYAASKRAIEALAESLAQEVADQGVSVVIVAPGPYQTSIWGTSLPRGEVYLGQPDPRLALYRELAEKVSKASTNRKLGDPAELAAVVLGALDARRPRLRYVAPFTSRLLGWVKALVGPRAFHRLLRLGIEAGGR